MSPYDALMDGYQRGIGAVGRRLDLRCLREFPGGEPAAGRSSVRRKQQTPIKPPGPFPIARRRHLCRRVAARIGLDFDHARLDRSAHPFSGGIPSDVRITTRYDTADFTQAIMAVIHETGHAMYERGLPGRYARQPVGEAAGMGDPRKPVADRRNACLPERRVPGLARPRAARARLAAIPGRIRWRISAGCGGASNVA